MRADGDRKKGRLTFSIIRVILGIAAILLIITGINMLFDQFTANNSMIRDLSTLTTPSATTVSDTLFPSLYFFSFMTHIRSERTTEYIYPGHSHVMFALNHAFFLVSALIPACMTSKYFPSFL